MDSSKSFIMQIAGLRIEICGYNGQNSACLDDLKRIFAYHEVKCDEVALHRIVVCDSSQFEMSTEATLRWVSTCLGVAGSHHRSFFARIFASVFACNKEIPRYSGTCDVMCYKDKLRHEDYFVPKNAEWRIKHNAKEHVTYVFSDGQSDMSDGLPSMLINVIGSQYGYYLLFASCVAVDGEALLFTGNSGVGKSTLCMELIRQGATYIGDDLVLVYLDGKKAMVGSLLFPIKCYADEIYSHKKKLDVVSQLPQHPPLNVPLKSVFLLQRTGDPKAESYLEPMQKETMFVKMLKLTNKANTNADGHHFVDTISSICSLVPCYYLFYGEYDKITPSFFC